MFTVLGAIAAFSDGVAFGVVVPVSLVLGVAALFPLLLPLFLIMI